MFIIGQQLGLAVFGSQVQQPVTWSRKAYQRAAAGNNGWQRVTVAGSVQQSGPAGSTNEWRGLSVIINGQQRATADGSVRLGLALSRRLY